MQGRRVAGAVAVTTALVVVVFALAASCWALTPVEQQVAELYELLRGQRVGMITNPTSVTEDLTFLPDKFALDPAVPFKLVAFFAPEHGLRGDQQAGTAVADYTDELTQRTVYSLYGTHRAPSKEQLDLVDAILFDIQDVGARFYTFVWTMTHAMEACARHNKTFVVLDRPNPIGAEAVEGPPNALNANLIGRKWPNAKWGLPTRHGMTVGGLLHIIPPSQKHPHMPTTNHCNFAHMRANTNTEIARLVDSEWMEPKLGKRLHVVKVPGYKRSMPWTALNRPWVMPSPNMPTPDGTALVYPGTGIFENVDGVTEGRGTTRPFELLGTPAADARTADRIVRTLNARNLPGCLFRTAFFTPTFSTFADELCGGLQIRLFSYCCFLFARLLLQQYAITSCSSSSADITDPKAFKPVLTSLEVLKAYVTILPDSVTVSHATNLESGIVDLDKNVCTPPFPPHPLLSRLLIALCCTDLFDVAARNRAPVAGEPDRVHGHASQVPPLQLMYPDSGEHVCAHSLGSHQRLLVPLTSFLVSMKNHLFFE